MTSKILKIILTFTITILLSAPLLAHPAKTVDLKWDEAKSTLDVSIEHPVKNTSKHYISRIVISVNGNIVEDIGYSSQNGSRWINETFKISKVPKGATIEVETTCNVFGKRKNSITL